MKKILFLTNGKKDMIKSKKYTDYIYAYSVFRYSFKLYKAFAKTIIKITKNDNVSKLLLGSWALCIDEYDIIVCEGLNGKKWLFEFLLRNKSNNTKIIMWHWNKIYENEIKPNEEIAKKCEQWTFDPDDSKKYNLKINTQYFYGIKLKRKIKWDAYFLGTEKNRTEVIIKMINMLEKMNLKVNFHIVKKRKQIKNWNIKYKKSISYKKNLQNVVSSKVIIDIPILNQRGLTLRVLEALNYNKKLISFNNELLNLPFYNENNILILKKEELDKEDTIDKINQFLNKPYKETEENKIARNYYSFENWMLRFCN